MSLRREIYKGRQGTPITKSADESNHWERDWYDPPIANKDDTVASLLNGSNGSTPALGTTSTPDVTNTDTAANGNTPVTEKSATPSFNTADGQQQLHGYDVKTWIVKNNELTAVDFYKDFDAETNPQATHINLNQYRYIPVLRKGVNLGPKKVFEASSAAEPLDGDKDKDKDNDNDSNMMDNDDQDGAMDATDIKAAVGGVGGDKLFSSSASIDRT